MLSMLVSLLVVIGLFLIVARVLRGIQPTPQRNLPKEVVEVLGRSTLAPRQQMYVVRFGRKLLLVSQQMGQSTTLSEIDDTREVDHMLGLLESKKSDSITDSFRDVLQQISFGTKKREPRSELASTGRHVKSNFDSLG
jgi:flagellar biogenesis protein FliO